MGNGWWQWCFGSLSHNWVPTTWGWTEMTMSLDYPWCLKLCKLVYTVQGVEQVMDVTGLSGIIICKVLWASYGKETCCVRAAYYYYNYYYFKFRTGTWNIEKRGILPQKSHFLTSAAVALRLWRHFTGCQYGFASTSRSSQSCTGVYMAMIQHTYSVCLCWKNNLHTL